MYFECPQCGKLIDMSVDELAKSHLVVVCPQCLTEFQARGVTLPSRLKQPEPASQPDGSSPTAGHYLYCFSCGSSLPSGNLRFCPFCGVSLADAETPSNDLPASDIKEPLTADETTDNESQTVINDDASDIMSRLPVIWPIVPRMSRKAAMGSKTLRTVCFIIIALLLLLFFYLVYLINADSIHQLFDKGEILPTEPIQN